MKKKIDITLKFEDSYSASLFSVMIDETKIDNQNCSIDLGHSTLALNLEAEIIRLLMDYSGTLVDATTWIVEIYLATLFSEFFSQRKQNVPIAVNQTPQINFTINNFNISVTEDNLQESLQQIAEHFKP